MRRKKNISVILALLMLMACVTACYTASSGQTAQSLVADTQTAGVRWRQPATVRQTLI